MTLALFQKQVRKLNRRITSPNTSSEDAIPTLAYWPSKPLQPKLPQRPRLLSPQ